jgi:hypothetical protein
MSSAAISRRLASGEWVRTHPGTYRFAVAPETDSQRFAAAALWAGEGAAVSHRTALRVWGVACEFDLIDVVTPHRRDPREGIQLHQVRALPSTHVTTHAGICVTTPERTLLDLASLSPLGLMREYEYEFSPPQPLAGALKDFLARGLVTQDGLSSFLSHPSVRGLPGRRMLARSLRALRDNSFEGQVQRFAKREGLPPLAENIPLDPHSPKTGLGYPELKLAILPREGAWPKRWLEGQGWTVYLVSSEELQQDPEYAAFRLALTIRSRGGGLAPPRRRWPVKRSWLELPRQRYDVQQRIRDWRQLVRA